MNYKLLKTEEDFKKYSSENTQIYIPSPKEYPAIILKVQEDPEIIWNSDSLKLRRRHDFEFIYPAQIQKELYHDDFESLIKK